MRLLRGNAYMSICCCWVNGPGADDENKGGDEARAGEGEREAVGVSQPFGIISEY